MKKTILIAAALILAAVLLLFLMNAVKRDMNQALAEERVWQHGSGSVSPDTGPPEIPADCIVDDSFSSHLPLIVIDTDGLPLISTGDGDSNPYVEMTMRVIDGTDCINTLSDSGTLLTGKIKVRGDSSDDGCKFQYRVKFLDTFGDANKYPLLGMDSSDEWILDGGASDNSNLRNYLAYNLAAEFGLNSPDVRFCEVLLQNGDSYQYMGLYLAGEPVEQGKGRVEFNGKRSLVGAYSYIVKRDGEDSTRPLLETWAYEYNVDITVGASDRFLTLVYPKNDKATEAAIDYITNDLSSIEQVLYSNLVYSDAAVRDKLNLDSFVDYYLLNEFMMNRDAGKRSTYMYKDIGGKLTMGPVWGFNDAAGKGQTELMTMDEMPLFNRLMLNDLFTSRLEKRWSDLRTELISEDRLCSLIEETKAYLGNALLRDHCRRLAFDGETGEPNSSAEKLLSRLLEHARWLDTVWAN